MIPQEDTAPAASPNAVPEEPLTCFVVMGFGKKTDFETGRVLDLNASYQNLIKPAVEAAGLKCIRADEINHSGLIDDPMYEHLLKADVVVADLSTSNRNAIYELGVRHALRPYTTVIIAEEGLMKSPFFDLNHIIILTYRHLGEDIGVNEMKRFTAALTEAIKDIMAKEPPELRRDSPVYRFLDGLTPPSLLKKASAAADAVIKRAGVAQETPNARDNGAEAYSEVMRRVDEAQKNGRSGWLKAKMLLEDLRESRKAKIAEENRQIAKAEDPTILQRLALATYKSEYPSSEEALAEARELLLPLDPHTSNDTETLGLWGSVHKQLWRLTKEGGHLDEAVRAYERGFYLRNDYYNGINYAFLLNLRAANASEPAEAIADFIQARRVRKEVIEICEACLASTAVATERAVSLAEKHPGSSYWVLATLAEAYIGTGDDARGQEWLDKSIAAAPEPWMTEATEKQLRALRPLLADSPLAHISPD